MQRKFIILLSIILLSLPNCQTTTSHSHFSEQVTPKHEKTGNGEITIQVSGKGVTKEDALQDAFRNAIERAFGSYVYSKTTVDKAILTEDKIVVISKGFIKNYEVIFENKSGDLIFLSVNVKISADKFSTFVRENKLNLWRDVIKDTSLIQFTQEKLRKFSELLKALTGDSKDIIEKGYSVDVVGYLVDDIGIDYIKGSFLVQIAVNDEFWNNYMEIMQQMATDTEHYVKEGLLGKTEIPSPFYNCSKNETGLGIIKPIKVHKSLIPFLAQPIDVIVAVDKRGVSLSLYKNAFIFGIYTLYKEPGKINACTELLIKNRSLYTSYNNLYHYSQKGFESWRGLFYKGSDEISYFSDGTNNNFALISPYVIIKIPFKLIGEQELKKLSFKKNIIIEGVNKGGKKVAFWEIHK